MLMLVAEILDCATGSQALDFADVSIRASEAPAFVAVQDGNTVLDLGLAAGGRAGEDTVTMTGVTDLRPTDILLA